MAWNGVVSKYVKREEDFTREYLKLVKFFQKTPLQFLSKDGLMAAANITDKNFCSSACPTKDFVTLLNWGAMIVHGKKGSGTALPSVWVLVNNAKVKDAIGLTKKYLDQRGLLSQPADLSPDDLRIITTRLSDKQPEIVASECPAWGSAVPAAAFADVINAAVRQRTAQEIALVRALPGRARGVVLMPDLLAAMARCGQANAADFLDLSTADILKAFAQEGQDGPQTLADDDGKQHSSIATAAGVEVPRQGPSSEGSTASGAESVDLMDLPFEELDENVADLRNLIDREGGDRQERHKQEPQHEQHAGMQADDIEEKIRRAQEQAEKRATAKLKAQLIMEDMQRTLKPSLFKTKFCLYHQRGFCAFADACAFAHGAAELRGLPRFMAGPYSPPVSYAVLATAWTPAQLAELPQPLPLSSPPPPVHDSIVWELQPQAIRNGEEPARLPPGPSHSPGFFLDEFLPPPPGLPPPQQHRERSPFLPAEESELLLPGTGIPIVAERNELRHSRLEEWLAAPAKDDASDLPSSSSSREADGEVEQFRATRRWGRTSQ